ncbi:MAG: VCBS repeat-containing protein [Deltaproteobacteria bacterium]|nr:VCBS repeat-containing protein [Deltaproteobacteria bacterium]
MTDGNRMIRGGLRRGVVLFPAGFAWILGVSGLVGVLLWPSVVLAGFKKLELRVPGGIVGVAPGDFDADGRTDLAVAYVRGAGPKARRFIGVFFRDTQGGFDVKPNVAFSAPRNAALFDAGDALGDAQDELVFFASDGIYAQAFAARKPGRPTKIVNVPTLAGRADEEELLAWDFLTTLDGPSDGRSDGRSRVLVVPTPRDLQLFRAEPGGLWSPWAKLSLQTFSDYDAASETYRRSRRGGSSGRQFSLAVTTVVPNVVFIDQTGDGRPDVVTHFEDRIAVFAQRADGSMAPEPTFSRYYAVRTDEELERRDTSIETKIAQLDADGIADLAITKIGGGITTLATEVRLFRGAKGGGFELEPAQSFQDPGFAALVDFVDVDGDGRLEMLHPMSAVSVVSMTRAMLASVVSLDVRIRRPDAAPQLFERKPSQTLSSRLGLDLSVGATLRGGGPMFGHDFDGDGRPDAVLPDGGDKMVLHRGRGGDRQAGTALFEDEGHITLAAPGSHKTFALMPGSAVGGGPDVVVYYVQRPELGGRLVVFRNAFRAESTTLNR